MAKIKIRAGGQVKLPAIIVMKYKLREGDIIDVHDAGNGIVFIPETVKSKPSRERMFELIEKNWDRNRDIDSAAFDRTLRRSIRAVRTEERKMLDPAQ